METTTSIQSQFSIAQLEQAAADYAGEFYADYDLAAVAHDWQAAINDELPEGVYLAANGEVIYPEEGGFDTNLFIEIVDEIDLDVLLDKHEWPNIALRGVAESISDTSDEGYADLVNAALTREYPNVHFADAGSSDFNLLTVGQNREIVSDQIDYERFGTMTPEQLRAFIAEKNHAASTVEFAVGVFLDSLYNTDERF